MKVFRKAISADSSRVFVPSKRSTSQDLAPIFNKVNAMRAIKAAKGIAYTTIASWIGFHTPAFWMGLDQIGQTLKLTPEASTFVEGNKKEHDTLNIDRLIANHSGIDEVRYAINEGNIALKDLNHDRKTLSTPEEIEDAINELEQKQTIPEKSYDYTIAIKVLEKLKPLKDIVLGNLNPETISQNYSQNCEIMAAVLALYLANNTDVIEILDSNLDMNNGSFNMTAKVHLNGSEYTVDFNDVVKSRGISPSRAKDGTVLPPILIHTMESKLKNYDGVRSWFPAGPFRLATGKDYTLVAVSSLSKSDLKRIFKLAPQTPIGVTSYVDLNLGDISKSIMEQFITGEKEEPYSPHLANEFKSSVIDNAKKVLETTAQTNNAEASNSSQCSITDDLNRNIFNTRVLNRHTYVEKSFNIKEDGSITITITDTQGNTTELPVDKTGLFGVIAPKELVPLISSKTITVFLIGGCLMFLIRKGGNNLITNLKD